MKLSIFECLFCGAVSSVLFVGRGWACPTHSTVIPATTILQIAQSSCADPCAPVDCEAPRPTTVTDSSGRGGPPVEISMAKYAFLPDDVVIKPNTTVRWNNTSFFSQHTSTRVPSWNSGLVDPGDFFDLTFTSDSAGLSYHYVCTVHGTIFGMEGDISVALFGDANLDTIVNLLDFNVLAGNFGRTSGMTWEDGDFNEDGAVTLPDFNMLAGNFGREIQPAGFIELGSLVPEPLVGSLLLPVWLLLRRKRTRKFSPENQKHKE